MRISLFALVIFFLIAQAPVIAQTDDYEGEEQTISITYDHEVNCEVDPEDLDSWKGERDEWESIYKDTNSNQQFSIDLFSRSFRDKPKELKSQL